MYKYTDKVILKLNVKLIRLFRKLRLMKFDELNAVNSVVSVYKQTDRLAKKAYLDVATYAYLFALKEAKKAGFNVKKLEEKPPIAEDWILDMLEESDFVTLYEYAPELRRKRQRLIEALAITPKPMQEIDKALKYVERQIAHYADKATAEAALKAFKDVGVKKVEWVTEHDNRVCAECAPLDGKVFDIDKVPPIPQHYHCRCQLLIKE